MTRFEKVASVALVGLTIGLVATIGILLKVKSKAEKRLTAASQYLRDLGEQYIDYTVHVDQTIPLNTEVNVTRSIPVNINMVVSDSVMIVANVPVNDSMDVPIKLKVNQLLDIDTTITVVQRTDIDLITKIPINQNFKTTMLGKGLAMDIPIEADIPVNQYVSVGFPYPLKVKSQIRAKLPIDQMLKIPIKMTVPMNQKIPLKLPIKQVAWVSFTTTMPIKGNIPIIMDIPVKIPLRDTPIKSYLDKVANELDGMLSF